MHTAEEAIDFDDVLARIYGSADFAEGVQAYLEKREPHWRGEYGTANIFQQFRES